MEEQTEQTPIQRFMTSVERSRQVISRGLWIVGSVSLAIFYPLALGVLEERFIKRGRIQKD